MANMTLLEFKALDGSLCRVTATEPLSEIQILPVADEPVADEEEVDAENRLGMPRTAPDCPEVQMMA